MKRYLTIVCLFALLSGLVAGCLSSRIAGGRVTNGAVSLVQSQDPKQASVLNQDSERLETLRVPAGSLIMQGSNSFRVAADTTYVMSSHDKLNSSLGGAQKNTLAETAAKLASLSWLTYLGAALVLFGAASAFYPPLKLIVGSATTSAVCVAVGVGFIALPSVLVSISPVAILVIGLAALGLWWASHHVGSISAELKTVKGFFADKPAPANPVVNQPTTFIHNPGQDK
jgi:hypothetical protein